MADGVWDTLAKKGYLGEAAKVGAETGRASWEPHSEQRMKEYHQETDKSMEEHQKRQEILKTLGGTGM